METSLGHIIEAVRLIKGKERDLKVELINSDSLITYRCTLDKIKTIDLTIDNDACWINADGRQTSFSKVIGDEIEKALL